jgi:hypothetical protein
MSSITDTSSQCVKFMSKKRASSNCENEEIQQNNHLHYVTDKRKRMDYSKKTAMLVEKLNNNGITHSSITCDSADNILESSYLTSLTQHPLSHFISSNTWLGYPRENIRHCFPSILPTMSPNASELVLKARMDQLTHVVPPLDILRILQDTALNTTHLASSQLAQHNLFQELLSSQALSRLLSHSTMPLRPSHTTMWSKLPSLQTATATTSTTTTGGRERISNPVSLKNFIDQDSNQYEMLKSLPMSLALPYDANRLSPVQILLREQIEIFAASEDDLMAYVRGRNKPITLKQVGIRCKHCANLPLKHRKRGSVYFPFSLLDIYQAAQNIASSHFFQDNCSEISVEIKSKLLRSNLRWKSAPGLGKQYWAISAGAQGLFDTDQGIRFI